MELRQLRYFLTLADELHFGRAARRLHLSQSALSQQVRVLERQLEVPLFVRDSRRVELTAAGRTLYEHAGPVLSLADVAAEATRQAGLAGRRQLTLGFIGNGLAERTTTLLRAFETALPDTDVALRHLGLAEHLQALRHGRVDLALVRLPVDEPDIDVAIVWSEPRVLVVPSGHRLARADQLSICEVGDEPVLTLPSSFPAHWRDFWTVDPRPDGSRPVIGPVFEDLEEAMQLVARGKGVLVAAASLARGQARPDLVFAPLADVAPSSVGLAWRRDQAGPLVRTLVHTARGTLAVPAQHGRRSSRQSGLSASGESLAAEPDHDHLQGNHV